MKRKKKSDFFWEEVSFVYHSLLKDDELEIDTNKLLFIFIALQEALTPPGNVCENLNTETEGSAS